MVVVTVLLVIVIVLVVELFVVCVVVLVFVVLVCVFSVVAAFTSHNVPFHTQPSEGHAASVVTDAHA